MIIQYNNNIKTNSILYFNAAWCSPCKALKPILETLDKEIISIDIEERPDIANQYSVMSLPTVIFLENGKEIKRIVGYSNPGEFKNIWQSKPT